MKIFPLHLIPNDTKFDFLRLRWISVGIAALLFVFSIAAIATKGFNFALDFTGGTVVELRFDQPPDVDHVREQVEAAWEYEIIGRESRAYDRGYDDGRADCDCRDDGPPPYQAPSPGQAYYGDLPPPDAPPMTAPPPCAG